MLRHALVSALFLTSCASIVSHSKWPVLIHSNPPGATVKVTDGQGNVVHTGTAPTNVTLSGKKGYFSSTGYDVEASLPGHPTGHAHLGARINGWYWGNFLFGGLIGFFIVDPLTGAMWKLDKEVTVELSPASP